MFNQILETAQILSDFSNAMRVEFSARQSLTTAGALLARKVAPGMSYSINDCGLVVVSANSGNVRPYSADVYGLDGRWIATTGHCRTQTRAIEAGRKALSRK